MPRRLGRRIRYLFDDPSAAVAARDRRRTVLMPWKERPPVAAMIAEGS
jgi:hypothetical protein